MRKPKPRDRSLSRAVKGPALLAPMNNKCARGIYGECGVITTAQGHRPPATSHPRVDGAAEGGQGDTVNPPAGSAPSHKAPKCATATSSTGLPCADPRGHGSCPLTTLPHRPVFWRTKLRFQGDSANAQSPPPQTHHSPVQGHACQPSPPTRAAGPRGRSERPETPHLSWLFPSLPRSSENSRSSPWRLKRETGTCWRQPGVMRFLCLRGHLLGWGCAVAPFYRWGNQGSPGPGLSAASAGTWLGRGWPPGSVVTT